MEDKENSDRANISIQQQLHDTTVKLNATIARLDEIESNNQKLRCENLILFDAKNRFRNQFIGLKKNIDDIEVYGSQITRLSQNLKQSYNKLLSVLDEGNSTAEQTPYAPPSAPPLTSTPISRVLARRTTPIDVNFIPTQMLLIPDRNRNAQMVDHGEYSRRQAVTDEQQPNHTARQILNEMTPNNTERLTNRSIELMQQDQEHSTGEDQNSNVLMTSSTNVVTTPRANDMPIDTDLAANENPSYDGEDAIVATENADATIPQPTPISNQASQSVVVDNSNQSNSDETKDMALLESSSSSSPANPVDDNRAVMVKKDPSDVSSNKESENEISTPTTRAMSKRRAELECERITRSKARALDHSNSRLTDSSPTPGPSSTPRKRVRFHLPDDKKSNAKAALKLSTPRKIDRRRKTMA